jgi:DNA-binding transcriptional LysR family regulator
MDLRQLRYFVTVAEELNFSRAALRLHMSQPPLSHQIKMLEDELGVLLLLRNRREVKLTDAGRSFLKDCRALLDEAQAASNRARLVAAGSHGVLRVGMATSAIDHVMPQFMASFRQHFGAGQLSVTDMGSDDQVHALAQDRLDLGFLHASAATGALQRLPVYRGSFAIVMPADHPLAMRAELGLRDLAEEPMVSFSREHRSVLFDMLVAACMNAGFSPRLAHVARHPMSLFQMVRAGLGVSVVPQAYSDMAGPGVHVQPLDVSAGMLQIDAVWRQHEASPLVQQVVTKVLAVFAPTPHPAADHAVQASRP